MPTYTFLNKETGKSWDQMMSISESEKFLKDNPNIQKVPTAINMVRSVMGQKSMRNDQGWKENMSRIADAHSSSNLATQYGDKSEKAFKTREAVNKWKRRRAADTSK